MSDSDGAANDPSDIAEEYLRKIDEGVDEERIDELEKELARLEDRRDELKQQHGEGHKLVSKITSHIDDVKSELQEYTDFDRECEEVRRKLLKHVTTDFELNEIWLEEEIIQAVSHALYETRDSKFAVLDTEIADHTDVEDLGFLNRIDMSEVIVLLAEDALDESDAVKEQWGRIRNSNTFTAFEIVARQGPVSPKQAANGLEEDYDTVRNWLKNPVYLWDRLIPFHRPEEGGYALSTTGKYYSARYWDGGSSIVDEESAEPSGPEESIVKEGVLEEPSDDQQSSEASTESETEESQTVVIDFDGESAADVEETEEKAERMFANVSDGEPDSAE